MSANKPPNHLNNNAGTVPFSVQEGLEQQNDQRFLGHNPPLTQVVFLQPVRSGKQHQSFSTRYFVKFGAYPTPSDTQAVWVWLKHGALLGLF